MGRIYSVTFEAVAVTAQQDLFEIVAPAAKSVILRSVSLSQESEVKDAAEEGLLIKIKSGQTTSGSGGTAPNAQPLDSGDAADGCSIEVNNTVKASVGTIITHWAEAWNIRAPFLWLPTEGDRIALAGGRRATVELATTPIDSITMTGALTFEEIG